MTGLAIRRYEPRDAGAIRALHERALSDAGAYDEEFSQLDADLRRIQDEYLDIGGEFLVGTVDGEVVAMGGFQPVEALDHGGPYADVATGDPAVVRRMRVDPDYQRRGFGTAILRELEGRATDRGFDAVVLDTTPVQRAAIAFYEDHGYEERGRRSVGGHELLFYGKELERA